MSVNSFHPEDAFESDESSGKIMEALINASAKSKAGNQSCFFMFCRPAGSVLPFSVNIYKGESSMSQPIIGITTFISDKGLTLPTTYIDAINDSDGVPMVLAKTLNPEKIKAQIEKIDALLLTGGNDIEPALFNEEPHQQLGEIEPGRDEYESGLIEHALEKGIPVLGICRGAQILNIQQGGTMYQDIYDQIDGTVNQHTQNAARDYLAHTVNIEDGSLLHRIVGEKTIKTNTFHHQANKGVPDHFIISATSPDGVIEAVESTAHDFVLGLQWHPEGTYFNDGPSKKIFHALVEAAQK